jgi:putative ABC transport system permease protein
LKGVIRAFLRYLARRKSLAVLQLLGIAFGVAAAVGMTLASRSALESMEGAVDFLKGGSTHTIARPAGAMEEGVLAKIMSDPAVKFFAPVIDRKVRLKSGDQVRLLGLDPFLDKNVRSITGKIASSANSSGRDDAFRSFMLDPRTILIDENVAQAANIKAGQDLMTMQGPLKVVQVFANASGEPLVIMDIGHAQEFFRTAGYIDRADLVVSDEEGLRRRWSQGFIIESNRQKAQTLSSLLGAFKLNLEALSFLALFVGIFLIYNTAMFTVVSRRRDAGILLSIGASRGQVAAAFLVEILILGIAGGALGGIMGYFLSKFLVQIVGGTISSLYFFLRPSALPWTFWNIAGGIFLGCTASIVGSLPPLIELRRVQPVLVLRGRTASRSASRKMKIIGIIGLFCLALSLTFFLLSFLNVYIGFAGAFAFLLSASLFAGFAIMVAVPFLKHLFSSAMGLPGKIAIGNIRENLGRTSVAVAAFMIALSMSIGLSSMIDSFRHSLIWWMNGQLRGDAYISTKADVTVPEEAYEELKTISGIGGIDVFRNVSISFRGRPAGITSIDAAVLQKYAQFAWLEGSGRSWDDVKRGDVIISESFSLRFKAKMGDRITIDTARGPTTLRIAGVYYDYASEHGVIMIDRSLYLSLFNDRTINSLGVFIDAPEPEKGRVMEKTRQLSRKYGLPFSTREQFHGRILGIFDSTFAVTRSMRIIAVIVAFFGIAGALMTLFVERQKEFGIYRALGFTTGDVAKITIAESVGLGLISFFMSTVVGTIFAFILIRVINRQSFNWTIFYHLTAQPYLVTFLAAIAASIAACAYPLWSVVRKYPIMQIREE